MLEEQTMNEMAYRFKVLGEPMRLRILYNLKEGEVCVQDLVDRLDAGQANISKHLSLMIQEGMLQRRKEGLKVYYSIKDKTILDICDIVCNAKEAVKI